MVTGESPRVNTRTMTPPQIRAAGLQALVRALGPAGMLRFLQEFDRGHGDYTAERYQWLARTNVQTLAKQITAARETEQHSPAQP
jgi:hypothetical protein